MTSREKWLFSFKNTNKLCDRDFNLLERASKILEDNVLCTNNLPWNDYRGICPAPKIYRGVWNWDSAFHAMGVSWWDKEFAQEQLRIFFDFQCEDGMFPDVIYENGGVVDNFTKPPVFPWACETIYKRNNDKEFLKLAYGKYKNNEEFWFTKRFVPCEGLFHYDARQINDDALNQIKCESGWDNSVRWDDTIRDLWTIDLNCYMVMFYNAMQFMAQELNIEEDIKEWEDKKTYLAEKINTLLWDEDKKSYYDVNRYTKKSTDVLSPASFMPLFTNIASKEQAEHMYHKAKDKNLFYKGMPTVAYNNKEYAADNYWRGPTWLNIAYFALKGLKNYGYDDIANEIKEVILDWCDEEKRDIYEYYNSKTGEGIGSAHFGWSAAFIIEFILNF